MGRYLTIARYHSRDGPLAWWTKMSWYRPCAGHKQYLVTNNLYDSQLIERKPTMAKKSQTKTEVAAATEEKEVFLVVIYPKEGKGFIFIEHDEEVALAKAKGAVALDSDMRAEVYVVLDELDPVTGESLNPPWKSPNA